MKRLVIISLLLLGLTLPSALVLVDDGNGTEWVMSAQARNKKSKKNNSLKKKEKRTLKKVKKQAKKAIKKTAQPSPSIVPLIGKTTTATQPTNVLCRVALPRGMDNQTLNYKAVTIYFNNKLRIPNCVAYELTNTMVSMADAPTAEKRKNYRFEQDHNAPGCPAHSDYSGSGYTRGHMAPAMDMRGEKQTMQECFYMTNMCPQEAKLNNDDWQQLEKTVHRWAKRDGRLIVLTGPIMGMTHECIGPRHDIAVPSAFFKVVYAPRQARAIAFIYDNGPAVGGMARHAVTIDEVERRTGLDFFTALGKDTERTIESQCNLAAWQ